MLTIFFIEVTNSLLASLPSPGRGGAEEGGEVPGHMVDVHLPGRTGQQFDNLGLFLDYTRDCTFALFCLYFAICSFLSGFSRMTSLQWFFGSLFYYVVISGV